MKVHTKNSRIEGIDFLRGLSILSVILMHVNQRAPIEETMIGKWLHPQIISCIFKNGYLGVIVFFVISGFLITSSSIKRWGSLENVDIKRFYSIRFARIAPCLIALLGVLSLLHIFGVTGFVINPQKSTLPRALFSALTFHLNWLEAKVGYLPGSWDVLWSLCVEEMFYLFFPIACVVLKREFAFLTFMGVFIILGPCARALTSNEIWQDHSYLSCMDGIALGCIAAIVSRKFTFSKKLTQWITWVGLCLFITSILLKKQIFQIGLSDLGLNVTLLEIATALLIISITSPFSTEKHFQNRLTLPFRWFGKNSYEIYLSHMFFVTFFTGTVFMDQNGSPMLFIGFFMLLVLSGSLGHFLASTFSEPANKWIRAKLRLPGRLISKSA